jgi:hypothetical protein
MFNTPEIAKTVRSLIDCSNYEHAAQIASTDDRLLLLWAEAQFVQGWYGHAISNFSKVIARASSDEEVCEARIWHGLAESLRFRDRGPCLDAVSKVSSLGLATRSNRCQMLLCRFALKARMLDPIPVLDSSDLLLAAHRQLLDYTDGAVGPSDKFHILRDLLAFADSRFCADLQLRSDVLQQLSILRSSADGKLCRSIDRLILRSQANLDAARLRDPKAIRDVFERTGLAMDDSTNSLDAAHTYYDSAIALKAAGFNAEKEYKEAIVEYAQAG